MNSKLGLVNGGPAETVNLDLLAQMPPQGLQQLHRRIFGCDLSSGNSEQARRRIAWHVQSLTDGSLPESARRHALAIAREADSRIRARTGAGRRDDGLPPPHATVTGIVSDHDPRLPMPGSVIVKEHHGRSIVVHVLDDSFEYDGRRFSSLSAVAKEITGTKWNGMLFFGLTKVGTSAR